VFYIKCGCSEFETWTSLIRFGRVIAGNKTALHKETNLGPTRKKESHFRFGTASLCAGAADAESADPPHNPPVSHPPAPPQATRVRASEIMKVMTRRTSNNTHDYWYVCFTISSFYWTASLSSLGLPIKRYPAVCKRASRPMWSEDEHTFNRMDDMVH